MAAPAAGHLDRVNAARRASVELGVSVADLQVVEKGIRTPTFGEYLPVVIAAGPGANRTIGTYWARMATLWGDRRLDELLASDIDGHEERRHGDRTVPAFASPMVDMPANTSWPQLARCTTGRSLMV